MYSLSPDWKLIFFILVKSMKHNPHLNMIFSNNKCYIVNKNSKELVGLGFEEQGLFQWVSIDTIQEHVLMTNSGQDMHSLWHWRYDHIKFRLPFIFY